MSANLSFQSTQAAVSDEGGRLSFFFLLPITVLVVGGLMGLILTGPGYEPGSLWQTIPGSQPESGGTGGISVIFTPEVHTWETEILRWAREAELDANMAATVMQIESCGDPQAVSRSGAMGLFQVMPYHFQAGENAFHPDTNALRGMAYLRRSLEAAGGEPRLSFAGYNGGIGVIGWAESDWPAETTRYAYWGSGIYADASSGRLESDRLQEWLQAGGASLCRQAAERLGLER